MDFTNVWTIAQKDLGIVLKKRQVAISLIVWPLVFSILLPALTYLLVQRGKFGSNAATLEGLMDAFTLIFIFAPLAFESYIAAYTFVGEKVEKTMEPLIVTPITDSEILLGKMLVAIVPVYICIYLSMIIFMILMNVASASLVHNYFPNGIIEGVAIVDLVAIIFSAEFNVIISSRVSNVITAAMIGAIPIIPFLILYVVSELSAITSNKIITLDFNGLLILTAVFLAIDIVFFFICRKLFQREKLVVK
jgi:ABC-type transport system involved in multi-copper enzyme maturation permease subunit